MFTSTMNLCSKVNVLSKKFKNTIVVNHLIESGLEEAFFVCDLGCIVNKHKLWENAMPRVKPHYAVKCNDEVEILETIAALGIGFDCASKSEIHKILSMGVDPDRIIYANPVKSIPHLRYARATGVKKMTFDNENELYKIKQIHAQAELIIRIKCDAPTAVYQLGEKFGCNHMTEAPELLKIAKKIGLNVIGVSFHIGSCVKDFNIFRTALNYARCIFDYANELGYEFSILDIGGGFPGTEEEPIEDIGKIINPILEDYFPDISINVIAEPGRYYVQQAYTLASSITLVKRVMKDVEHNGKLVPHNMYYIDVGVYGSFSCALFGEEVFPKTLKKNTNGVISSSIWGPSCDGFDLIVKHTFFPDIKMNDWIIFENMGAYSLSLCTNFNGFSCPDVYFIIEKSIWETICEYLPVSKQIKSKNIIQDNPKN